MKFTGEKVTHTKFTKERRSGIISVAKDENKGRGGARRGRDRKLSRWNSKSLAQNIGKKEGGRSQVTGGSKVGGGFTGGTNFKREGI